MTNLTVPMVSSDVVRDDMKATRVHGITHNPRMPKAHGERKLHYGSGGPASSPDASYRHKPSSSRWARSGRGGRVEVTPANSAVTVRGEG